MCNSQIPPKQSHGSVSLVASGTFQPGEVTEQLRVPSQGLAANTQQRRREEPCRPFSRVHRCGGKEREVGAGWHAVPPREHRCAESVLGLPAARAPEQLRAWSAACTSEPLHTLTLGLAVRQLSKSVLLLKTALLTALPPTTNTLQGCTITNTGRQRGRSHKWEIKPSWACWQQAAGPASANSGGVFPASVWGSSLRQETAKRRVGRQGKGLFVPRTSAPQHQSCRLGE